MRTLLLLIFLYPLLLLAQGSETDPVDSAGSLARTAHVNLLQAAVRSLQIENRALQKRVNTLLAQNESLRVSATTRSAVESYITTRKEALVGAGADPDTCQVDLLSGKITCAELTSQ